MKSSPISTHSVDWSSILDALQGAKQYGNYIHALCPFHDDTHPSFFVYGDSYRCLSCGAFGKTENLLVRLGKVVKPPQPHQEYHGPDNPFSKWISQWGLSRTLHMAWQNINQNPGLGNYITQDRGIDETYRQRLGIGYIDDWYTIPIRDRNGIIISAVARKGRDNQSIAKYVLPNGTNPALLYVPNWKRVRNAPYLVITFGILDAVVLALMGFPAASTISGKKMSKVSVEGFRIPILIIADRREESNGMITAQSLGWRGNFVRIDWPDGCKDINDIWVKDREQCRNIMRGVTHGLSRSIRDQCWPDPQKQA